MITYNYSIIIIIVQTNNNNNNNILLQQQTPQNIYINMVSGLQLSLPTCMETRFFSYCGRVKPNNFRKMWTNYRIMYEYDKTRSLVQVTVRVQSQGWGIIKRTHKSKWVRVQGQGIIKRVRVRVSSRGLGYHQEGQGIIKRVRVRVGYHQC